MCDADSFIVTRVCYRLNSAYITEAAQHPLTSLGRLYRIGTI